MKRVMLYCRVSTERQAKHGDSIEDQIEALRSWANEHDCIIIGEYIDAGFSGAKPYTTRPEFCRMLKEADELHPDMLLFTRLDRFTRNPRDYYNVAHIFEEHHLQWKAIWQDFDTTTAAGQAMIGTMIVFAKLERDNTSDRIKAHNVEKRARGELVSGNLPKGYMIKDKKPVKDPTTEKGVNAFWRTYLEGKGLNEAIKAASLYGVTFAGCSSASYMLRNAKSYTGTIQGIQCEPYITEAECNIVLSQRKSKIRRTDYTFLFRGLVKCAECGGNFGSHRHFYRSKKGGGEQVYYNCSKHYATNRCSCTVNIYESDIESFMLANLSSALDQYTIHGYAEQKEEEKPKESIQSLEAKRKRIVDAYIDGLISREDFSKRCKDIDDRIEGLKEEPKAKKIPAIELPDNWKEMYDSLDRDHKRAFWFQILKAIYIHSNRSISFEFNV